MKTNNSNFPERERRYLSADLEIRAAAETENPRQVRGYAAVFDSESQVLSDKGRQFIEKLSRDAFNDTDMSDVVCLFNHDNNYVLGRSKNGSGSMKLGIDDRGLFYELEMPNTSLGNDLLVSIQRGDIQSSSFAFAIAEGGDSWVREERNGKSIPLRTINRISHIFDASLVVSPAYPDASVALRSLEQFQQEQEEEQSDPEPTENHFIAHRQRALDLIDKSAVQ